MMNSNQPNHLPKLAVWKFTSCDGCQLSLLDCEDELLQVAETVDVAVFMEASRRQLPGPYDISIVEGSITTPEEAERIQHIRQQSKLLITLGACATSGGIQALRNFANVDDYAAYVYASPEVLQTLATSTPISAHVKVDYELNGCPINKQQLLEVLIAFLQQRRPQIPNHAVCVECKLAGNVCVTVTKGQPCLGPITHAGCGAICPTYQRGCYGCYGPKENANPPPLTAWWQQQGDTQPLRIEEKLRTFQVAAPVFHAESERLAMANRSNNTGVKNDE